MPDRPDLRSPHQFKLFMTGVEWQQQVNRSTDGPIDAVWAEKTSQARAPKGSPVHGAGTKDSMLKHGYDRSLSDDGGPRIIIEESLRGDAKFVQSEGHHRVAAAADIQRETGRPVYIPTNYVDNTRAGRRDRSG